MWANAAANGGVGHRLAAGHIWELPGHPLECLVPSAGSPTPTSILNDEGSVVSGHWPLVF
ncbi:hypothetical protein E4U53_001974, partial [Claviceps sorghi]